MRQVVLRGQAHVEDLPRHIKVPQVRPRVMRASLAGATFLHGVLVELVLGVGDDQLALGHKELPIARVPRRHDTVERVRRTDTVFSGGLPGRVSRASPFHADARNTDTMSTFFTVDDPA